MLLGSPCVAYSPAIPHSSGTLHRHTRVAFRGQSDLVPISRSARCSRPIVSPAVLPCWTRRIFGVLRWLVFKLPATWAVASKLTLQGQNGASKAVVFGKAPSALLYQPCPASHPPGNHLGSWGNVLHRPTPAGVSGISGRPRVPGQGFVFRGSPTAKKVRTTPSSGRRSFLFVFASRALLEIDLTKLPAPVTICSVRPEVDSGISFLLSPSG